MKQKLTQNEFHNLYYKKNKSFRDLADITGYNMSTIRKWFKNWGFKSRTLSESCKLRCKLKPQTNPGRKGMPKGAPLYGKANPSYKKGWWMTHNGYKKMSWLGGEILEHHYVWCIVNKRDIPEGHQIHHINHDKLDNRIENLLCLSNSEHQKLHEQPKSKDDGRFIKK